MKKLLHIIAAPRGEESRTLKISQVFVDALRTKEREWKVEEFNLFQERLPDLTVKRIDGKYILLGGKELPDDLQKQWKEIIVLIEQFLSADAYLISAPMWNFGVPYVLKHYIDVILQPKYLFRYTAQGPEGLVKNKKMVVVTSRGGDYSLPPAKAMDLQEPYLRTIFGLAGIVDITFIHGQPMDAMGPQVCGEKIQAAQVLARQTAEGMA